jgi:ATP-binding protein involved in chromosome partitioning
MTVTGDLVLKALKKVIDPELGRDIVSMGMIRDLKVQDGRVSFTLVLTTPACPFNEQITRQAKEAVESITGVKEGRDEYAKHTGTEERYSCS